MDARNADIASFTALNRGVYYLQRLTHVDGVDADPKEINSIKLKALRHVDSRSSLIACCKSPFDRHSERSEQSAFSPKSKKTTDSQSPLAPRDDIAKDFSTRLLSGFCGPRAGFLQEFTLDPFVGDGQSKFKRH